MCTHSYPKIYVVMAELKAAANSDFKESWCGHNPTSCKLCIFIGTVSLISTELQFSHSVYRDVIPAMYVKTKSKNNFCSRIIVF